RKAKGLSRGSILSLQYRYPATVDLFKYELFDVKIELELEAVISSHCLNRNVVIKLYVEFAEVDGAGLSSATVAANVGIEAEAKIPTTSFCSGFTSLLQSSYYDVPKTSMGRHSSVFEIDGGNTYTEGLSTYTGSQSAADFIRYLGYKRTDDLLPTIGSDESTSNPLIEDDNKGTDKEEDASKKEETTYVFDRLESDHEPTRQSSLDVQVPTEPKPYGSDEDDLDNALDPDP
ncbi:hypothetical protein J1N35_004467, partial [Gossypium stocksii]